jgi:hypothetical protein
MNDVLSEFAAASVDFDAIPSEEKTKLLAEKAKELWDLEEQIDSLETRITDLKTQRHMLRTKVLPDIMNDIDVDVIGVPGSGVNIELVMECHANISTDWDDAKKVAAYDHLRAIGGEDLIKQELVVSAGRGSDEKLRQIAQRVTQMLAEVELEASIKLQPKVAWNTLTAFVRSVMKEGKTVVDLEAIGATYQSAAKIVKKKEK